MPASEATCSRKTRLYTQGQALGKDLLFVVVAKFNAAAILLSKVFVTVKAHVFAYIDAYQEIISRHISRKHQILIYLLNQLCQLGLFQFTL